MNRYMPLVMLVVLGQAIIAYLLVTHVVQYRLEGPPPEELAEVKIEIPVSDEPEKIYRDLGIFLINTSDTTDVSDLRFLLTEISLGVSPASVYYQIEARNPHLRDAVIAILTGKSVNELDDPEDRELIKDEIRVAVSDILPPSPTEILIEVNFLKFLIQ